MSDSESPVVCAESAGSRQQLEAAVRKLEEAHKMASLGRLVASIVHEINTPIGSILSNNEVILRSLDALRKQLPEGPEADKAREIVETMACLASVDKIACQRILGVIRGLKTFARVDEGDRRKANVHDILADTLKLCSCEYRRRITVDTDFGELPEIECHPQLLSQVFLNLLVNAAQAIDGEGRITVRTQREGDCIRISVSDTGRGIKPEDRSKIFTPGFTTKAVGVGSGLGLKISREIVVDVHGGSIDFESQPGAGTTFHVRIPIHPPEKRQ